jgi:type II secretory pathway pseudopilin PulG
MAKNKNRKQGGAQSRTSQAEQAQEQARRSSTEAHESPVMHSPGSPADVARKQQKRFGHN